METTTYPYNYDGDEFSEPLPQPDEYILPSHFVGYLINGDTTGYSDEELQVIQSFEVGKGFCVGVKEDSPFFRHGHALNSNEGADCYTFLFW